MFPFFAYQFASLILHIEQSSMILLLIRERGSLGPWSIAMVSLNDSRFDLFFAIQDAMG